MRERALPSGSGAQSVAAPACDDMSGVVAQQRRLHGNRATAVHLRVFLGSGHLCGHFDMTLGLTTGRRLASGCLGAPLVFDGPRPRGIDPALRASG